VRTKRIVTIILSIALLFTAAGIALAANGSESAGNAAGDTNYMALMIQAACSNDVQAGQKAQEARDAKIAALGLDNYKKISFEDLHLLGKIIYWEAGSEWLSDHWKLCVGEVVLNRVASPEFPGTIKTVVYQKGQYSGANSNFFKNQKPSERCVVLALKLLEGERALDAPSVVFQANFRQGSGVHTALYDSRLGWTYFCYSSRPYLYA